MSGGCFGEYLAHQAGEGRDIMSGEAPASRPRRRYEPRSTREPDDEEEAEKKPAEPETPFPFDPTY